MARVQTPAHLRREYETVYLIGQDFEEPVVDKLIQKYREFVAERGGKVVKLDNWGKRKLAYPINKQPRATYVYMQYLSTEGVVAEVERDMRLSDEVVRWQTVVIDDAVDPGARPEASGVTKVEVPDEDEAPAREARGSRDSRDSDDDGPPRRDTRRTEEEE